MPKTWRGQVTLERLPLAAEQARAEAAACAARGDDLGALVGTALADVFEAEAARTKERER